MEIYEMIEQAKNDPSVGRYFLLVLTENRADFGMIPLALDGSEDFEKAEKNFRDALAVSAMHLSAREGYYPVAPHIDRRPRTEYEIACADFASKAGKMQSGDEYTESQIAALYAAKQRDMASRNMESKETH